MNMGRLITQLKQASSVPAGSSYVVAMGDGTGTKQVSHETVVESVGRDLPLGDVEELETENKTDIVGAVNEIVEKLSIVGISYKGEYNPETEYRFLDAVFHENSTFIAMKNSPEGEPLADGINWQYLAKGFMDGYLIAKSQIVNNLLATEPGNVLDAMQGKALADMISGVNSNLPIFAVLTGKTPSGVNNESAVHLPDGTWNVTNTCFIKSLILNDNGSWYEEVLTVVQYRADVVRVKFRYPENAANYVNRNMKIYVMKIPS